MRPFAFLDRDGTLIWEPKRPADTDPRDTFPLTSADEVRFLDGALEGLKTLRAHGYGLVLVTNQTYLGTNRHPQDVFDAGMHRMNEMLAAEGITFDFVMVCPHGPDEGCTCRKPAIGGVEPFIAAEGVNLTESYMFGDRDTDRQFAENLGVAFVRIETNQSFVLPQQL